MRLVEDEDEEDALAGVDNEEEEPLNTVILVLQKTARDTTKSSIDIFLFKLSVNALYSSSHNTFGYIVMT